MSIRTFLIGTAICAAAASMPAAAQTTIDFSPPVNGSPSYTEAGVTFTPIGGGTLQSFGNSPNGTPGILGRNAVNSAFVPIRATFSSLASNVSIDLGDYNSDDDDLFLRAYGVGNTLLGSTSGFIPSTFTGMVTLSLNLTGISYVEFGGVGFNDESNVYADNFTFTAASGAVPEPATWALMILGFGATGATMRRRPARAVLRAA